ncbi:hypothetical protein KD5_12320 [Yersinia pseudotuberculosis]|uniref:Uncharacterized protein n=1 Tax=Yersinia pseudotuberculosis serotype O:1b (strain IP 31758) TaxID=349747 RepID=A0A0U1QVB2_YERP3|nr:hypothetical protein YpsIP31758_1205 [Yersinia pseudotuberculosis IP 31758]EIS30206.1 hypothetical protein YPPY56_3353 [Yersinia pestis PY-56]EIS75214.1 hypothetical protein YPPY71_3091 [Yersinia pestis PY-71]QOW14890.1 hypothetical protein S96127_2587 [Yersinia pestis]BCU89707.1 hypothetical protein YP72344_12020 [Yersinia pseudotuberculosis]
MVGVEATGSGTVTPGDETTAAGCAKEPELILNNIPAKRQWRFFWPFIIEFLFYMINQRVRQ